MDGHDLQISYNQELLWWQLCCSFWCNIFLDKLNQHVTTVLQGELCYEIDVQEHPSFKETALKIIKKLSGNHYARIFWEKLNNCTLPINVMTKKHNKNFWRNYFHSFHQCASKGSADIEEFLKQNLFNFFHASRSSWPKYCKKMISLKKQTYISN